MGDGPLGAALRRDAGLLTSDEAAALLGIKASTLRTWRMAGRGPDVFQVGERRFMYSLENIRHWLADRILVTDHRPLASDEVGEGERPLPLASQNPTRDAEIRARRDSGATLEDIARDHGLTKQRVSKICMQQALGDML